MTTYQKGDEFLWIEQEDGPESPRKWDNLGTMVTWHRRYSLGDKQPEVAPEELRARLPAGTVMLPLYLFDHGALHIRTSPFSCSFDSGQIGYIYATPERLDACGVAIDDVANVLQREVEVYQMYLEGAVYEYTMYTKKLCATCGAVHRKTGDSCGGFYGDDHKESGLLESAGITDLTEWKEING